MEANDQYLDVANQYWQDGCAWGLAMGAITGGVNSGGESGPTLFNSCGAVMLWRELSQISAQTYESHDIPKVSTGLDKDAVEDAFKSIFSHTSLNWQIYRLVSTNSTYGGTWFGVKITHPRGCAIGLYARVRTTTDGTEFLENYFYSQVVPDGADETTEGFTSYKQWLSGNTTDGEGNTIYHMYGVYFDGVKAPYIALPCRKSGIDADDSDIDFFDRLLEYNQTDKLFRCYHPSNSNAYTNLNKLTCHPGLSGKTASGSPSITDATKNGRNDTSALNTRYLKAIVNYGYMSSLSTNLMNACGYYVPEIDGELIDTSNLFAMTTRDLGRVYFVIVDLTTMSMYLCQEIYDGSHQFRIIDELANKFDMSQYSDE